MRETQIRSQEHSNVTHSINELQNHKSMKFINQHKVFFFHFDSFYLFLRFVETKQNAFSITTCILSFEISNCTCSTSVLFSVRQIFIEFRGSIRLCFFSFCETTQNNFRLTLSWRMRFLTSEKIRRKSTENNSKEFSFACSARSIFCPFSCKRNQLKMHKLELNNSTNESKVIAVHFNV